MFVEGGEQEGARHLAVVKIILSNKKRPSSDFYFIFNYVAPYVVC